MNKKVVVEAPCKINLTLDIIGKRDNGYHDMQMVMQSLDFYDYITINRIGNGNIEVTDKSPQPLQGKESISYRVAEEFFRFTGIVNDGIEIDIENNIPACAGLAGGSADGAGVVVGLNHMFETQLSKQEMCQIGIKVGADIPFCIIGGTVLTEGIGEKLTALRPLDKGYFVIIKPKWGVSTPEAFELFDKSRKNLYPDNKAMLSAIENEDLISIGESFGNVFQYAFENLEITQICKEMVDMGALGASMTGSGSAVFGLFETEESAHKCFDKMIIKYEQGFIACPCSQGAKIVI